MNQSKSLFDVANLNEDEKKQRLDAIDFLFKELLRRDSNFTLIEAEQLYDNMQQKAIDTGHSFWSYYRKY